MKFEATLDDGEQLAHKAFGSCHKILTIYSEDHHWRYHWIQRWLEKHF